MTTDTDAASAAPECMLGNACGMASTHTNKAGERCCDFCHRSMTADTHTVTLKPCPFCGSEADIFFHNPEGWEPSCHVECLAENCGNGTCHHERGEEAIAAWNTRQDAVSELVEENARLRAFIAGNANRMNTVGSPWHQVQAALDSLVTETKRQAREALSHGEAHHG